jgi:hypothetical protein
MAPTSWDRRQATTSLVLSLALVGLTMAIVVATDEPDATWGRRFALLVALSPVLGGAASGLVLERARVRGELLALGAIGASPRRAAMGAALGGALPGLLGAVALCAIGDTRGLFPALPTSPWAPGGGRFAAPTLGASLDELARRVEFFRAVTPGDTDVPRVAVALALGAASLGAALFCTRAMGPAERAAGAFTASVVGLVAFHAIGRGASAAWLFLPAIVLAAHAALPASSPHRT